MVYNHRWVSLIIPTVNRDDFLVNSLADALSQKYHNYEIIVVDQSNTEISLKIKEMIRDNAHRLFYYKVKFRGLPEARNFGAQKAKGDILIYIDDDTRFGLDFIAEHVRTYKLSDRIGLVAGGIDDVVPDICDRVGCFNKWFCLATRGFGSKNSQYVDHVPGGNFSIQKNVLLEAGCFAENLNVGAALYEELEFCLRSSKLGCKIYFNANARVKHLQAPSGGCRIQNDVSYYVFSLAHNRSFLIIRYLSKLYWITSYFRLSLLFLSYARLAKQMMVIVSGVRGVVYGVKSAKSVIKVSDFDAKYYERILL